jgi:23S rRNA (cytidine1920-2'-O)/16S rRNA (cytidine1409-2'-O)-methyltransferase
MIEKKRIDIAVVEWGFFESRNKAQAAIEEGLVFLNDQKINKSNQDIDFTLDNKNAIRVESGQSTKYVSRGGIKMEGALKKTGLNVSNFRILDVGLSTGGFSDCLLQKGAKEIVGIDVGHKQIHESLLKNPKLHAYEGVHVKNLSKDFFAKENLNDQFDLVVCDVSFISLKNVLPHAAPFLKTNGVALFLVKPQFELSREDLSKGGLVKDETLFQRVEKLIKSLFEDLNFKVLDYFESSITGTDGNQEFFVYAEKKN